MISIGFVVIGMIWLAVFWRARPGWPGIYATTPADETPSTAPVSV